MSRRLRVEERVIKRSLAPHQQAISISREHHTRPRKRRKDKGGAHISAVGKYEGGATTRMVPLKV